MQVLDLTHNPFDHSVTICVEGNKWIVRVKPANECKLMYGTKTSDAKAAEAKPGRTFEFPWEGPLNEQLISAFSSTWLPHDKKLQISRLLQRTPIRLDITPNQRLLLLDAPPKDSDLTLKWTLSLDKQHSLDTNNKWLIRSRDPSWSQPLVTATKVEGEEGKYTIEYPVKEAPVGEYWPEPAQPAQFTWKTPPKYSIQVYQLPTPPTPIVTPTPDVLQVAWQPPPNASLSIDPKTTVEWRSGPPGSDSDWKLLVVGGDTPLHDFPAERDNEYQFRVKWKVSADGIERETTSKPSEKAKLSGQCITEKLFEHLSKTEPNSPSGEGELDDQKAPQRILQDIHKSLMETETKAKTVSSEKAKNLASKVETALGTARLLQEHPDLTPKGDGQKPSPQDSIKAKLDDANNTLEPLDSALNAWRNDQAAINDITSQIERNLGILNRLFTKAEQAETEWCKTARDALRELRVRENRLKDLVKDLAEAKRQLETQCEVLKSTADSLKEKVDKSNKISAQIRTDISQVCKEWSDQIDKILTKSRGGAG